jgi:hypothetical protein
MPRTYEASRSRFPDLSRAQPLDRHQQHLLDQIRRGLALAQVFEPIQAHARGQTAIKLGLRRSGCPRARGCYPARQ